MPPIAVYAIASFLLAAGGFTAGWRVNAWKHDSQELVAAKAAQEAAQAVSGAAVEAISRIDIKRVTVRQELEREIRYLPAGCDLPDGVYATLNKAITGQGADSGGLPRANPAAGQPPRDAGP